MKNYVSKGDTVDYVASGAKSSGDVVTIGTAGVGVCVKDIADTATGPVQVRGIVSLAKATGGGTALTFGARVWWDSGNSRVTTTPGSNNIAGIVSKAAADGDATVEVRLTLNGDSDPLNLTQAANVAALTEGSGAIGGSNDGDLPSLTPTQVALDLNSLTPDAQQDIESVSLAGTLTGSVDGTIEDVAAINIGAGDPAHPSEAEIEAAVNPALVAVNLQLKEIQTKLAVATANDATLGTAIGQAKADIEAAVAAVREVAAKVNAELAALKTANLQASS